MTISTTTSRHRPRLLACALLATVAAAQAGEHEREHEYERRAAPPSLPIYQQECGACHLAYPPSLLPAASWRQLMAGLPHHFGSDATLDATTTAALSAWLSGHAAGGRRAEAPPEPRITRSTWFVREHREVEPATWKRPAVKSAANCAACHSGAEQGDFDEHAVHIPS